MPPAGPPDQEAGERPLRPVKNYESLQLDLLFRISRRCVGMPDCNPYNDWYNAHQIFTAATPQRGPSGQEVSTETGNGEVWKPFCPRHRP